MGVPLLSLGRPSKARHSGEPHRSYGCHPENSANCRPKTIERQDQFSCRSMQPVQCMKASERSSYLVPNLFLRYDSTEAASFSDRTRL
jgi:hypothetical protein